MRFEYESMIDDLIRKLYYKEGKEITCWQIIFKKLYLDEQKAKIIVEYEDIENES